MAYRIRAATVDDLPGLRDMLWEAAAVAEVLRELGKEASLQLPEVWKYLDGWKRPGDTGVVAVDDAGRVIGAAWYRFFTAAPGYGYISDDIPELAIGVDAAARGQGVGDALLRALIAEARAQGLPAIGLSVDKQNRARRLYERLGFRDAGITEATETSLTMILKL